MSNFGSGRGNSDILKVKFTQSNTVRDKKPYTVYEIEVSSSSTITWMIWKRYSDFHSLHQLLSKKITTKNGKPINLPQLPPKKILSMAAEFVEKRKQELEAYLKDLLLLPQIIFSPILLTFLEVPDSVIPMLERGSSKENPDAFSEDTNKNYVDDAEDKEEAVKILLKELKNGKRRVAAIKSFEKYFFEKKVNLNVDYIKMLFEGKDSYAGLIQTCGDFKYSHVSSRAALELLRRLLDIERNKDAQLFLDTFCSLEVHVLKRMQLDLHILSKRGKSRPSAFQIISILKDGIPDLPIEKIVMDTWARSEYIRWADRQGGVGLKPEVIPQDNVLKAVNLAEVNYRVLSEEIFKELAEISGDSNPRWNAVESKSSDNLKLEFKIEQKKDTVVVRATTMLPFCVDDVTKLVVDSSRRKEWDVMFHRGKRVEKIDKTCDIVHYVFKSFSSPYKYRDFALFRSWGKFGEGGRVLGMRSVLHSQVKDNVRAVLGSSGYILYPNPAESKECSLTYIAQMDRESVLIISPDLLGETHMMYQSIENLKRILSSGRQVYSKTLTLA